MDISFTAPDAISRPNGKPRIAPRRPKLKASPRNAISTAVRLAPSDLTMPISDRRGIAVRIGKHPANDIFCEVVVDQQRDAISRPLVKAFPQPDAVIVVQIVQRLLRIRYIRSRRSRQWVASIRNEVQPNQRNAS